MYYLIDDYWRIAFNFGYIARLYIPERENLEKWGKIKKWQQLQYTIVNFISIIIIKKINLSFIFYYSFKNTKQDAGINCCYVKDV